MKLYVAFVLLENGLGGKILGVRLTQGQAKLLCQIDYDLLTDVDISLEWLPFTDGEISGQQSITPKDRQYYVEEAELEVSTRESDPDSPATSRMDWKDRRILQLIIDNGSLAQNVMQLDESSEVLKQRIEQLAIYIDGLLKEQGLDSVTFKNIAGEDENWEIKK